MTIHIAGNSFWGVSRLELQFAPDHPCQLASSPPSVHHAEQALPRIREKLSGINSAAAVR